MERMYSLNPNLFRTLLPFPGWRRSLILASALVMGVSQTRAQQVTSDYYVAVGNDASQKYEVYDPSVTDWNSGSALKWTFAPTIAGGWTSSEVAAWSNPSDMKMRLNNGNEVVVTCASGGLATEATYPGGTLLWTQNIGGANNPHSVELLPNKNIAVAASTGNFVRLYAASQGNRNGTYASFSLTGAHAVLWDPQNNVLWALGTSQLVALLVGGTAANPTLTEDATRTVSLPATSGHDLSPYWGDPDKLWVTVSLHVYVYSKSSHTFMGSPGSTDRTAVKGCGNQPSGEIAQCQQDNSVCTLNTWCTPNVNFFTVTGAFDYTRTRTGAAFYKCRIFMPDYQPGPIPMLGNDFDGDGVPDAVLYNPVTGLWSTRFSGGGSVHSHTFGQAGDIPFVTGDYDGDGQPDTALWRPSNVTWYTRFSADASIHTHSFGTQDDIPLMVSDYDGDGQPDEDLFRPSTGYWYVRWSSDGSVHSFQLGQNGDIPLLDGIIGTRSYVTNDFDGDGKPDSVSFRSSNGEWLTRFSSDGSVHTHTFGQAGDVPFMTSDFDGDGHPDTAVFRPSNGTWYIRWSSDGSSHSFQFGQYGDIPLMNGDFDGDGIPDAVIYRPSNNTWYVRNSSDASVNSFSFSY